jgi:hypothetical protein
MDKLSLDKITLKKFSITLFITLLIIGTLLLLKHKYGYIWFYSLGILFFLLGLFTPFLLKPVHIIWMRLVSILGWINTRILLSIIFYLIFTPIGLAMKLFGVDLLDKRIKKERKTYWKKKEKHKFNPLDYERQF